MFVEGVLVRVLGVDPGLTRCGLGVVDGGTGRTVHCVDVGVVRTPVDEDLATRLLLLSDEVERWLDRHAPDVVAVERVFSQYNVRTAMGTAQAGGVVALAAARRNLPVTFHTPSEVKAAVTGSGRADKAQVTTMVTRLLHLAQAPTPADAADALALAICHLWRAPMRGRLAEAEARAKELARHHKARLASAAAQAAAQAARQTAQAAQPTARQTAQAAQPATQAARRTAQAAQPAAQAAQPAQAPRSAAQAAQPAAQAARQPTQAAEPAAQTPEPAAQAAQQAEGAGR